MLSTIQAIEHAKSAYLQKVKRPHGEALPIIPESKRRAAVRDASKLPSGLRSDKESKSLDRELLKAAKLPPGVQPYTLLEANQGIYNYLTDSSSTQESIRRTYGISERSQAERLSALRKLSEYSTVAEDRTLFRRYFLENPSTHA